MLPQITIKAKFRKFASLPVRSNLRTAPFPGLVKRIFTSALTMKMSSCVRSRFFEHAVRSARPIESLFAPSHPSCVLSFIIFFFRISQYPMPRMNGAVEWDAHMSILWHCFRDVNGQSERNRGNERGATSDPMSNLHIYVSDHMSQMFDLCIVSQR